MSTEQETLIYLDPSEIIEPEITNVRPWSSKAGDTEEEIGKIKALAATIEEEGQLQPVRVRAVLNNGAINPEDVRYELVAGRRRAKAIKLINSGRKPGNELKVAAIVSSIDVEDPSAFRQAAIENWHREGLSPMDMALDIQAIRERAKWEGQKNTKKVAEFFKVSPATITQHEKLLKLDPDIQEQIHQGKISRDAAFVLVEVPAEQRPTIIEKAAELQKAESSSKSKRGIDAEAPDVRDDSSRGKKPIKSRHIKKAAREAESSQHLPRSKKEILEFFEGMLGPRYGYPNGAVHIFVNKFLAWSEGKITSDNTLLKYWDEMVDAAPKGKPEPKAETDKPAKAKPKK